MLETLASICSYNAEARISVFNSETASILATLSIRKGLKYNLPANMHIFLSIVIGIPKPSSIKESKSTSNKADQFRSINETY